MKRLKKIGSLLFIVSLCAVVFLGCASKQTGSGSEAGSGSNVSLDNLNIRLFNGPPQGTWRPIANMIKQVIEEKVPGSTVTIEAGGGASNVIAVNSGEGDLAMSVSTSTIDGWKGLAPYEGAMENVREVGILFEMPVQIITFDPNIKSVQDIKGKRVSVQQKGYATEVLNAMLLQAAGMSYNDIDAQFLGEVDSADSMRDGHLDVNMFMSSLPNSVSLDLFSTGKANIIPVQNDLFEKLHEQNSGVLKYTIPANSYSGQSEAIETIATSVHLIAKKDLPDEVVEAVTKALVEGLPQFKSSFDFYKHMTPEVMAQDIGIPMHPGAEKYYKEANILK